MLFKDALWCCLSSLLNKLLEHNIRNESYLWQKKKSILKYSIVWKTVVENSVFFLCHQLPFMKYKEHINLKDRYCIIDGISTHTTCKNPFHKECNFKCVSKTIKLLKENVLFFELISKFKTLFPGRKRSISVEIRCCEGCKWEQSNVCIHMLTTNKLTL